MSIAIIIAGGSGTRMGQSIPKQFISIRDTPVLIYMLNVLYSRFLIIRFQFNKSSYEG